MANTGTAVRPFGMRDKLGYMFGDFGNDFTFMLSSSFMMVFYTDIMGVPSAIVGLLMMVARFVDAFTDVAMGQIVDRAKPTKDGRFRPWIKRMCGPVAIASFLIYQSEFAGMPMAFTPFRPRPTTAPSCPPSAASAPPWPTWSSAPPPRCWPMRPSTARLS